MEVTQSHKYTWEAIDINGQLQRYFYGEIKGNGVF